MQIDDMVSLKKVFIHDARLYWGGWFFEQSESRFTLEAWQLDSSFATYNSVFWWVKKRTIPWRKYVLGFSHVTAFAATGLDKAAGLPWFELSTLNYDTRRKVLVINTHYVLSFELQMSRLWGTFVRTDDFTFKDAIQSYIVRLPRFERHAKGTS